MKNLHEDGKKNSIQEIKHKEITKSNVLDEKSNDYSRDTVEKNKKSQLFLKSITRQ